MAELDTLRTSEIQTRQSTGSVMGPVLGGPVGGAAGLAIGIAALESADCAGGNACLAALIAPAVLEPLGMALGTHWGNGSRGSVGFDLLVSGLAWGAALGIDEALTERGVGEGVDFVWMLPVQLGIVVLVERATGRN